MKRITQIIIGSVCLPLLGGCSFFEKTIKAEPVASEERTIIVIDDNKSSISEKTENVIVSSNNESSTNKSAEVVSESVKFTSEDYNKGIISGDWAIESVIGKEVVSERAAYLMFEPATGAMYGCNGCNIVNGHYKIDESAGKLEFYDVLTTMRACGKPNLTDTDVNYAINNISYYTIEKQDSEYVLRMYNNNKTELLKLIHQDFDFLNGTWVVTMLNGDEQTNPDMKLVIDVAEKRLHGNTGCNLINGTLETDMEIVNSISFQQLTTTMMACDDNSNEMTLLVALEEAMYAKPIGTDKVALLDNDKEVVIELKRSTP